MKKLLVSGVAGFIGTHAAAAFMRDNWHVVGFDNLSRNGCTANLDWLRAIDGAFEFRHVDIRLPGDVDRLFADHGDAQAVLHLAGQVAVTSSVQDPRSDFETNALGTLNVLEATRLRCPEAVLVYSSTNKVYGGMEAARVAERAGRYAYEDLHNGIGEDWPLDFHSPYGCSKGAADQYVRDYARIYGLRTVVLRQSCVYGTHQFGIEDQGWIAWFIIATILGRPITIFGDGMQVRDVLWVEDLVRLYARVIEQADMATGQVYNVGGGPANTLSLNELVALLSSITGRAVVPARAEWRPGDQKVFVADIRKARGALGWEPTVAPADGVVRLYEWARQHRDLLERFV